MASVRSRQAVTAATATSAAPKPPLVPASTKTNSDPRFLQLVPYVTGPLVKGTRIGTSVFDILTISNGATTGYAHPLGRVPNGFKVWWYTANIQMWQTAGDLAAQTATTSQWHGNGAVLAYGEWL